MCALLVVAFFVVLFSDSFIKNDSAKLNANLKGSYYDSVGIGETVLLRVNRELVWVTRLNLQQKDSLKNLNATTIQHQTEGVLRCTISQEYCAIDASTKEQGIQLRYTKEPPSQLPAKNIWVGGFVNPSTGAVYDLLGRAYLFQGDVEVLRLMEL